MGQHDLQRGSTIQHLGGKIHIGQQTGRIVDDDLLEAAVLDQPELGRRLGKVVEKRNGGIGGLAGDMREFDRHCHLLHHWNHGCGEIRTTVARKRTGIRFIQLRLPESMG